MNDKRWMARGLVIGGTLWCGATMPAAQSGVTRVDLQRHDLSVAGREAVQVRVELAPGVSVGRHFHHGEEIIYMVAGSLEYQIDGQPPVTLKAGEVLFVPAGAV